MRVVERSRCLAQNNLRCSQEPTVDGDKGRVYMGNASTSAEEATTKSTLNLATSVVTTTIFKKKEFLQ